MQKTTLFKLDSTGTVREWTAWVEQTKVHIRHGILNGNQAFESRPHTTEQNAKIDLARRIKKQMDRRGYTDYIPEKVPFLPMLAKRYQEFGHELPPLVYYQPKLDGYRCLGSFKDMRTRTNNDLPAFPHIQKALSSLPPEIVLDGELYVHEKHFQHIMKSRTLRATTDSIKIEYHVFDLVETNITFEERMLMIPEVIQELRKNWTNDPMIIGGNKLPFPIKLVPSDYGPREEADKFREHYEKNGYEGAILRDPSSKYELNYRSPGLIKYKKLDRDVYTIIDVIPSPKEKSLGILVCKLPNGNSFEVTPKMTKEEKRRILKYPNTVIGFAAEVEYTGFTLEDKPKNAVGIRIIKW